MLHQVWLVREPKEPDQSMLDLRHRWRTYFLDHDSTETVRDEENRPVVIALSL